MKLIKKEANKLEKACSELKRRRTEWTKHTKSKILSASHEYAKYAVDVGYPYRLIGAVGSEDINFQTVQISFGVNSTGIIKTNSEFTEGQSFEKNRIIIEKGCALVFSQCPSGEIMVLLCPYKSEVHSRAENNIILHAGIPPEKITKALVRKYIDSAVRYARISSLSGIALGLSFGDKWFLFRMKFLDQRAKNKRKNALINLDSEWLKIIITALVTWLITLVTQHYAP
ncbi:hypothetical protein P5E63_14670 [Vibrio parahaemolyticus]|nr:hypothetical protein [Vibrio parahaemolyticus]HAV1507604.1 hypothetical protein [Vibrio parahaemolyticus]HCG5828445.1 hypothetical protein [Vibrio parahaemolyticus]HCG5838302.1 hypothetical protein [Vibrio parahaemolyticus]HCM0477078.1 hypothetical protein [Vibrio parahaemolyticus]